MDEQIHELEKRLKKQKIERELYKNAKEVTPGYWKAEKKIGCKKIQR